MTLRRLLPDQAETTVLDQVATFTPFEDPPADAPYLYTNFALTIDGKATIDGRSGSIGSDTDTAMLVGLRTRADAVMIGSGTLRAEGYGRVVGDPAKRELRESNGLSPDPLMVIVCGPPRPALGRAAVHRGGRRGADLHRRRRRRRPRPRTRSRSSATEGGRPGRRRCATCGPSAGSDRCSARAAPPCTPSCVAAGLVDELFVTRAPKLAGGEGPGLFTGLAADERDLELVWLLTNEQGELYARYRVG